MAIFYNQIIADTEHTAGQTRLSTCANGYHKYMAVIGKYFMKMTLCWNKILCAFEITFSAFGVCLGFTVVLTIFEVIITTFVVCFDFTMIHSWMDPKITYWLVEMQLDIKQINQFSTFIEVSTLDFHVKNRDL